MADVQADVRAVAGEQEVPLAPLWTPLAVQPGRGLRMPDGRVLSPQQAAAETQADELFFGGGLGGGKSYLLLGLGVQYQRNTIIFRREFSQFKGPDGLIDKSKELVGMRGDWNGSDNSWRHLPGGRAIQFAGVKNDKDWRKWAGRPHDGKFFDELPQIPEHVYRKLIAWRRTGTVGQRVRVVGTGNPPMATEEEWVNVYWAAWLDPKHPNRAKPGELRWYVVDADGKDREVPGPIYGARRAAPVSIGGDADHRHGYKGRERICECGARLIDPMSRTFIPAAVDDNPIYMATGYASVLDSMPEPLRSMARFGNFAVSMPDHERQIIPTAWVLAAQARWRPNGGEGRRLTQAGCDVSRGGKDEFVVALNHEGWVQLKIHEAKDAPEGDIGAALVFEDVGGDRTVVVQIDVGGNPSVYDFARKSLKLAAVDLLGERTSITTDKTGLLKFANMRMEWQWRMREALDPKTGDDLALPPDDQLRADLCATRWFMTARGTMQAEPKEDVKKRLGRSPDRGEGTIYACIREMRSVEKKVRQIVWGPSARKSR